MRAVLLAFCVATTARGAEPVYEASVPAPAVEGALVWRSNGVDVHGIWATDAAVRKLQFKLDERQAQIDYLTDKATRDCIKTTDADTKAVIGSKSSLWIVGAAALVVGIVGGMVAEKHFGR